MAYVSLCILSHHCSGSGRSVSSLLLMLSSILPHGPQHPHPSRLRRVSSLAGPAHARIRRTLLRKGFMFLMVTDTLRTDRWYFESLDVLFALFSGSSHQHPGPTPSSSSSSSSTLPHKHTLPLHLAPQICPSQKSKIQSCYQMVEWYIIYIYQIRRTRK